MRYAIGGIRIAVAALIVAAIVATYIDALLRDGKLPNPFNFFGFFTIQNNVLAAAALALSAVYLMRGRAPKWLPAFRGAVVVYIVLVGIVYVALLAPLGAAGGVPLLWANTVMHYLAPIVLLLDWVLVADRPSLSWRRLWVVLPYPAIWLAVVLIRGASDGWVPYPFLSPSNGYVSITIVGVGILLTLVLVQALVTLASRIRLIRVLSPDTLEIPREPAIEYREGASA